MALRVDSSSASKAVIGLVAVSAVAVGTVMFMRYRRHAPVQPAAPALDQGRFSSRAFHPLQLVCRTIYNYLYPAKKPEPVTCTVGSPSAPITSMDELSQAFSVEMQRLAIVDRAAPKYPEISSLVIYGEDLQITQDPGFITLRPSKLILVGTHIVADSTLKSALIERRWHIETSDSSVGIQVASVADALLAPQHFIPSTGKHVPTVYSVKA
jgi:hypothetical protein